MRVIAGEAYGAKADVEDSLAAVYVHCELAAGARVPLPNEYSERAAYVASGSIEADDQTFVPGKCSYSPPGGTILLTAVVPAVVILLGGEPLGERFIEWNFVSSSKERIDQAKADWRAGRMKLPDLDNGEFIPLPGDPAAPANPMS